MTRRTDRRLRHAAAATTALLAWGCEDPVDLRRDDVRPVLRVEPRQATLPVGDTLRLVANVTNGGPDGTFAFATPDSSLLSVTPGGTVTARGPGLGRVVATWRGWTTAADPAVIVVAP